MGCLQLVYRFMFGLTVLAATTNALFVVYPHSTVDTRLWTLEKQQFGDPVRHDIESSAENIPDIHDSNLQHKLEEKLRNSVVTIPLHLFAEQQKREFEDPVNHGTKSSVENVPEIHGPNLRHKLEEKLQNAVVTIPPHLLEAQQQKPSSDKGKKLKRNVVVKDESIRRAVLHGRVFEAQQDEKKQLEEHQTRNLQGENLRRQLEQEHKVELQNAANIMTIPPQQTRRRDTLQQQLDEQDKQLNEQERRSAIKKSVIVCPPQKRGMCIQQDEQRQQQQQVEEKPKETEVYERQAEVYEDEALSYGDEPETYEDEPKYKGNDEEDEDVQSLDEE